MANRKELYRKVPRPGDLNPVNVELIPVNDEIPSKADIRVTVKRLCNGNTSRASGIYVKDIKRWLCGAEEEEEGGPAGAGDKWQIFMRLVHLFFEHGEILVQVRWVIIILIPKGYGDYWGIGLIEPIHKMVQLVVDGRLEIIDLHNCLHSFLSGCGMGTAIMELKLAVQLAYLDQ